MPLMATAKAPHPSGLGVNLPPESKTGGLTFSPAGRGSQEGSYFWGGSYFWVHPLCCHFTFPDTEDV